MNQVVTPTYGQLIVQCRKTRHMSQAELSRLAGISRSYLCDIERGRNKEPTTKMLRKLAGALAVDPKDLHPLTAGHHEAPQLSPEEEMVKIIDQISYLTVRLQELRNVISR